MAHTVALSADEHQVAIGDTDRTCSVGTCSGDGTAGVWQTSTGGPVATVEAHAPGVPGVALSADGQRLVTGSFDGMVKLWEANSGTCLASLRPELR